jgi:tetratricopeptide (TPR) repeat protein
VTEERNQKDLARQLADSRATEARAVVDFLVNDLIRAASPSRAQGKMPTVDKVLAQADQLIPQKFGDQPLIEASIRHALGQAYVELGQYEKAQEHARRAVELRLAQLGPEHVETIAAQNSLGWATALDAAMNVRYGTSEEERILATRVFATARKVLGPGHKETLQSASVLFLALFLQGKFDEDRALLEEYLPIFKRVLGPEDPATPRLMSLFGVVYKVLGDREKARQLAEETVAILRRVPPDHPEAL